MRNAAPELSIVVPVLNERQALAPLFAMLERQRSVRFELLLVDGGSTDGTPELALNLAACAPFPCRLVRCEKGRGRQLNTGARTAGAVLLLFLHVDCEFADSLALHAALAALRHARERRDHWRIAGRFALRFAPAAKQRNAGYYFYECKARLDRPGCTHGDQGYLLCRDFFAELGSFDESLPVLEDTRFAEEVRRRGEWILLPAEIVTSPRRFESEGLLERQLLNALIMNFEAIGWNDFFRAAEGIYRRQDRASRLRLVPFFRKIRERLASLPFRERCRLWYRTGTYVRANAWQIVFGLDVCRAFRRRLPPGQVDAPILTACEPWLRLSDHPPGRLVAMALVWAWFHLAFAWRLLRESRPVCRAARSLPEESNESRQPGNGNPHPPAAYPRHPSRRIGTGARRR